MIKNIGIIGIGGVGGYFGGKLCQLLNSHPGLEIYFIARGKHLVKVQNSGLILNTSDEGRFICTPTLATDDIANLPKLDLCIICVKIFDLENVLKKLKNKIKSSTIILPLLNGVDIYSRIKNILATGIVLPACVYVGTHIEEAGVVTQKGGACKILFGNDSNIGNNSVGELDTLLKKAKIKHQWYCDVNSEIWQKFIFISSFGLVTASFGKTIGEVIESEGLKKIILSVMNEVYDLALELNINLPSNIVEVSFNMGKNFPYETKTSFQRNFEDSSKFDERELFGGTIIRLCKSNNVNCKETEKLHAKINELKKL